MEKLSKTFGFTLLFLAFAPFSFSSLTGTFLQLDGSNLPWREEEWRKELSYMRQIGMDTLIIASVAFDSTSFYPSRFLSKFQQLGTNDPVETLLSLSDKMRIDVHLGLYSWNWEGKGSEENFENFAELNIKVAKELYSLYSKHPSFKGWYILSWELGNAPPIGNVDVRAYKRVVDFLRKLNPKKKIIIAPYFTLDISPEKLGEGWRKLLPFLKIDILALQDGVGCDRGIKPAHIPSYFSSMKKACEENKVEFWGDLEIFDIPAGWKPAKMERIREQIEKMKPFVKKIVVWEFNHYMSSLKGEEQRKLYEEYKDFYQKEVERR